MPLDASKSDEDLMSAYGGGDAGAFDELYKRHKGGVYRYLLRQCRDRALADEMFQDVWMNLIRSRERYTVQAKFSTFVYTLAHHRLIDHYRKSGQATLVSLDDDDEDGLLVKNVIEEYARASGMNLTFFAFQRFEPFQKFQDISLDDQIRIFLLKFS